MNSSERRTDTRLNIRVPLRFRALNEAGSNEQIAESGNLSQRGLYFATHVPLEVGSLVEVILRMPKELFGRMATEIKCTARVVHVRVDSLLGGKAGIGLHIERYEAAPIERERWAS